MRLEGIYPAVATPFNEHGVIDGDALESNLSGYFSSRLAGVLLLGSTGEAIHLNAQEQLDIVERGSRLLPPDKKMIVGVSGASLQEAASFARSLSEFPVTALLAGVPAYFKGRMTNEALARYYLELADASPFPLLLYNVPQYTNLRVPVEVVAEASRHERIVGMKESSGDLIYVQEILYRADPEFQLLTGCSQVLGPCLTLGIRGAILAVACAVADLPIALLEAFDAGQDIRQLQRRLFKVSQALTSEYGIPGLKFAMDTLGLKGGHCRLPLLPLQESEKQAILSVLRDEGLLTQPVSQP